MEAKLAELEQRSKSNTHRLEEQREVNTDFERRITCLERNSDTSQQRFQHLETILSDIKSTLLRIEEKNVDSYNRLGDRLAEIEKAPAKNWNTIVNAIITALASGLAGAFLMQVIK